MDPSGNMPHVEQPWGFAGVRREDRNVFADSRNFYVDPNNILSSDQNSGEDPANPLLTIQRAVTLARACKGDTIYVLQNDGWQYGTGVQNPVLESVIIPANKPGLRLVGVGSGSPGVYWSPAVAGQFALTIRALDTVVEGFCFESDLGADGNGIYVIWGAPLYFGDNVVIRNCSFMGTIDIGIQLEYVWYGIIQNCYFEENDTAGIYVDTAGSGASYLHILGNRFHDCAAAMILEDVDNSVVERNFIYNTDAQNSAAATNEGINTTGGQSNIVADNYFSCRLPVPAAGDYDDFCTAAATDSWIGNHCMNGPTTTNPT